MNDSERRRVLTRPYLGAIHPDMGGWIAPKSMGGEAAGKTVGPAGRVLIGGVGYRWLGDASFGLIMSDQLASLDWPAGVEVADLGYGALYVALDLADAEPAYDRLILLSGVARGRRPGRVYRYRWDQRLPDGDEIQARVREAVAGVIDLDHLLIMGSHLGALPEEVVVIELEPVHAVGGDELSTEAARVLPEAVALARREALAPLAAEDTAS